MRRRFYETERRDYKTSTPLIEIDPKQIRVLSTTAGVMTHYQKQMSKAVWRPAPGRKLGFLVLHGESLLGLIFLASPVIRLAARDRYLFPNASDDFDYGTALRHYMDMSVCVAAQPIGWHWNIGKLLAMLAPTLGDYVEARYPENEFKGVITTSLYGGNRATQYTRVYRHLGETEGFGHEHISDDSYEDMKDYLLVHGLKIPSARFGDGSNVRMRVIRAYATARGERVNLNHGHKRGVYFHPAVPCEQRRTVIDHWYERWGLPRYEHTKDLVPPYRTGLDARVDAAA